MWKGTYPETQRTVPDVFVRAVKDFLSCGGGDQKRKSESFIIFNSRAGTSDFAFLEIVKLIAVGLPQQHLMGHPILTFRTCSVNLFRIRSESSAVACVPTIPRTPTTIQSLDSFMISNQKTGSFQVLPTLCT